MARSLKYLKPDIANASTTRCIKTHNLLKYPVNIDIAVFVIARRILQRTSRDTREMQQSVDIHLFCTLLSHACNCFFFFFCKCLSLFFLPLLCPLKKQPEAIKAHGTDRKALQHSGQNFPINIYSWQIKLLRTFNEALNKTLKKKRVSKRKNWVRKKRPQQNNILCDAVLSKQF